MISPSQSRSAGRSNARGVRGHRPLLSWSALFLTMLWIPLARAGTNNVPGCTEQDFTNTIILGGYIAFTQDCSITLSATVPIQTETTLDAQGHNVTISGGHQVQLFSVNSGPFTGIGLTFTGGSNINGGALIVNSNATMILLNCILSGNAAAGTNGLAGTPGSTNNSNGIGGNGGNGGPGTPGVGGAIYNLGNTYLQNCILTNNSATGGNGGAGGDGGSAPNQGGNGGVGAAGAAGNGGAIYNGYNLTVTNCTFAGNTATAGAGGAGGKGGGGVFPGMTAAGGAGGKAGGAAIWNDANINITSSTFSGNQAQGGPGAAGGNQVNGVGSTGLNGGTASGGGIYSGWWGMIVNCTFYNNNIPGGGGGNGGDGSGTLSHGGNGGNGGDGNGGGMANVGTLAVTNSTIANCNASGGTNGVAGSGRYPGSPGNPGSANGGGIANLLAGTFTLANSLLSTNLAGLNGYGTIVAGGYNLSSDTTPASLSSASKNKNPLLGSLGNNGGQTQTIPLVSANSPAYAQIPAGTRGLPAVDQRGVARPAPGKTAADIGAYELLGTTPAIITQPPALTIATNGGSVSLTVSAVGSSLQYQWQFTPSTNTYYGDTPITAGTSNNFPFSTSPTLSLSGVSISNAGSYVVVVTNTSTTDASVTSSNAVLRVTPYITVQPTNAETHVGYDASFAVVAAADERPTYQWFQNQTNTLFHETNSSYKLMNALFASNGFTYNVVISNSLSSVTSVLAVLKVDSPPMIIAPPTDLVVAYGGNTRFTVSATGSPALYYQWRFNGQPVGVNFSYYPVNSAQSNNAGLYDVVITNVFGSVTSTPAAILTVLPPQATSPVLSNAVAGSNGFGFSFYASSNFTYTVQYTNRLGSSGNWPALTNYTGSNGVIHFLDSTGKQSNRFYRVMAK